MKFTSSSSRDVKKSHQVSQFCAFQRHEFVNAHLQMRQNFCLILTSKYQRERVHSNLEKFLKKVLQRLKAAEQSSPSAELSRWSLSNYQHSAFCSMYFFIGKYLTPSECWMYSIASYALYAHSILLFD